MSKPAKLFAIKSENKSTQQLAHEAVVSYREQQGLIVGEGERHRGWPPDVTLAFMEADVDKPKVKLTQSFIDTGHY